MTVLAKPSMSGALCVHAGVRGDPGWTVSHVNTGRAIVAHVESEEKAIGLMYAFDVLPFGDIKEFDDEANKAMRGDVRKLAIELRKETPFVGVCIE